MYLVSGGLNNTVNIWDLKSKRVHRSLKVSNFKKKNLYRNVFISNYQNLILSFYDNNKQLQNEVRFVREYKDV